MTRIINRRPLPVDSRIGSISGASAGVSDARNPQAARGYKAPVAIGHRRTGSQPTALTAAGYRDVSLDAAALAPAPRAKLGADSDADLAASHSAEGQRRSPPVTEGQQVASYRALKVIGRWGTDAEQIVKTIAPDVGKGGDIASSGSGKLPDEATG